VFELSRPRFQGIVKKKGELLLGKGGMCEYGVRTGMKWKDRERLTQMG